MNTIIIYSSKYGSTETCAKYLETTLSGAKVLVDIDRTNPQAIHLDQFDTIVIGSSIYVGKVRKKIRSLCQEQADLLLKKRVAIFLCCGFSEQSQEYFSDNFAAELLKHAIAVKNFGGEARLDQMNAVDKLIMKAATKGNYTSMKLSQACMDDFVTELNSVLLFAYESCSRNEKGESLL